MVRVEGEPPAFDFTPQPHWDLGPRLEWETGTLADGKPMRVESGEHRDTEQSKYLRLLGAVRSVVPSYSFGAMVCAGTGV